HGTSSIRNDGRAAHAEYFIGRSDPACSVDAPRSTEIDSRLPVRPNNERQRVKSARKDLSLRILCCEAGARNSYACSDRTIACSASEATLDRTTVRRIGAFAGRAD